VDKFRTYEWVAYVWGGYIPTRGWDCSGACNWVCGNDFQLAIPGFGPGGFNPGSGHGPVVGDWIQWIGVAKYAFGPVTPQPGDLIAWGPNVHMGMAINGTRFVSAANPTDGTFEADIATFFPYSPYILRILQVLIRPSLPSVPPAPGPGRDDYSPTITRTSQKMQSAGQSAYRAAVAIRGLR
jgi:cell wall-associated NlpC family hydrolase